jgi:hypothetical protein
MPVSLFDARQKFVNFAGFLRFSLHYWKTKPQIEKKIFFKNQRPISFDYNGVYYYDFEGRLIKL